MRHTPISRRIMQASQRLRVVAKYTVGVDDIDTEAATDLGIMVCHAPTESNCFGVAETTITFMLSLLKKVAERDADVRAGKWRTPDNFAYYVGSRASDGFPGQTIGLVGFGRIGTRVAQLLAPWRARIIAYDPYVPPAHFLTHGVTAVDYETLLRQSDVVSFHVVLTKETRYMFGEEQLELMKPNAIVINTARGKVVDERRSPARSKQAACAAPRSTPSRRSRCRWTSPLRQLGDRVVLSPHSASYTEGGELRQGVAWATRSVVTALNGGIPDNVYNRDVIPRWKERFGGRERGRLSEPSQSRLMLICVAGLRPRAIRQLLLQINDLSYAFLHSCGHDITICCDAAWNPMFVQFRFSPPGQERQQPCCSRSSASSNPGGATTPACASSPGSATASWPISASAVRTFRGSLGTLPTSKVPTASGSPAKAPAPVRALSLLAPTSPVRKRYRFHRTALSRPERQHSFGA